MKKPYVRWAAMILALLCFSIAAYFCGKIYYTEKEYAEGDAAYGDILADVVISEEEVLGESSEPTSETGEQVEETDEGVQAEESLVPEIDFVSLKEINEDVVGWLYLPDTVINYPVVQGEDNSYYLKHLVDGSYNANGSLFVDYHNKMDFSDDNTLIYGHHMDSGKMFATLVKYKDQEFYDAHPVAYFLTEEKDYKIEIFSGYVTTHDSDSYLLMAGSREQTIEWMKEMFHNADFFADVTITPEDHAEIPMVVVTNEDRVNGAATMFYPGVMDEIGEKLGGNFFVLPSSLHETIVVPNDGNMEYKALLAMVTEINATEVDKQDKLTDQVYHYDVTDKVFEKASRYEDRKQEKDKSHEKKSVLEKLEEKKDEAKATIGAKKTSYRDAVSL